METAKIQNNILNLALKVFCTHLSTKEVLKGKIEIHFPNWNRFNTQTVEPTACDFDLLNRITDIFRYSNLIKSTRNSSRFLYDANDQ